MENMLPRDQHKQIVQYLIVFSILLTILAPIVLSRSFGIIKFGENEGNIGDAIGGMTAPITSLMGSLLVYFALKEQITANRLIFAQMDQQKKITKNDFFLRFYNEMSAHNQLHIKLTFTGFQNGTQSPSTPEEWLEIGRLMGTFEFVNSLIDDEIMDIHTVDQAFSYRIVPLLKNSAVTDRFLNPDFKGWDGFKTLLSRIQGMPTFTFINDNYEKIYSTESLQSKASQS